MLHLNLKQHNKPYSYILFIGSNILKYPNTRSIDKKIPLHEWYFCLIIKNQILLIAFYGHV